MDFSFQLYSARKMGDVMRFLPNLAGLGYSAVEGYEGLYADYPALSEALATSGLAMPIGHFGLQLLHDRDKTRMIAEALGIRTLICPFVGPLERPKDRAGWSALAATLEDLAVHYRASGFGFAWHNHDFEFTPLPDASLPLNVLLDEAPTLDWQCDLGWLVRAGADPATWLHRYGARLVSVHVKDIAKPGEGANEDGWADVGEGTMNWPVLFELLSKHTSVRSFVLEHDNPSDAVRFAQRSIHYLQGLKE